jgi:DNA-binding NarL/FixJ family response regulator
MTSDRVYTLIIVDDHESTRDGVGNYLTKHGPIEVIGEFGETRSLLNSHTGLTPDIILLDLNLPGIDGEDSCSLLKQRFPKCKIIAFSQYNKSAKDLMRLGFDGSYAKSERMHTLVDVIKQVMSGNECFSSDPEKKFAAPVSKDRRLDDDYARVKSLSDRELQVIQLWLKDFSSKEIGEQLTDKISPFTVNKHLQNIKEKLDRKRKSEIEELLRRYGLL